MKFTVALHFAQYSVAEVEIEADSQQEAEERAEAIEAADVETFNPIDGELTVESVVPTQERQPA